MVKDVQDPLFEKQILQTGFFYDNSILFEIEAFKFTFVGQTIYTFDTEVEIVKYVFRISVTRVPYPFAFVETKITKFCSTNFFIIKWLMNVS